MLIEINDLASKGQITDQPAYMLPPEAWTLALNMRSRADGMERIGGWEQVFGTPTVVPYFVFHVSTPSQPLWIYASLTAVYVYDGSTHTDITRAAGAYNATAAQSWNKTVLGGIPIINNGTDVPQMWSPQTTATDLVALTNWPAGSTARVLRAFGPYLVAFNVVESGTAYPHRVMWSHPADPGTVPTSWDYTDPTVDAGINDLPDVQSGIIYDALPLQSTMFVYKQGAIWRMRTIGGRFIFSFDTFLETVGCLATRCVAATGDGLWHVVVTQNDIIRHNGVTVKSILTDRMRKEVFTEIDSTNYATSFLFCHTAFNEMWFCYPSQGASNPDTAVVWNYITDTLSKVDGITFRAAELGEIEGGIDSDWDSDDEAWDDDVTVWAEVSRHKIVVADPTATKLYVLDEGATRDGTEFTGTLQREGLALLGRKRNREWIVDFNSKKMVRRVWPKVQGAVDVSVGGQDLVDGPITWRTAVAFDPTVGVTCDFLPITARALAIEFSKAGAWRIDGYGYEVMKLGNF